jgi:translocation and assembly module TamA
MKKYMTRYWLFLLFLICYPIWAQKELTLQIKVEGLQEPLKNPIVSLLAGRSQDISPPLTTAKIRRFYQQTPDAVRRGLQPYGYFKPQISARLEKVGNTWTVIVSVNPGPPVKIIHVDLALSGDGVKDTAFKNLAKNLPIKAGQVLNVDYYQQSKDALFNLAANRGYFDAKMTANQIIINLERQEASVVLHFDTGPRYRFGQTLFPPSDLNSDFLARFLRYEPGEYYNSLEVQKTQQVLAGSGYFSQSVVTPLTSETQASKVPMKVELTPVKPRRYTIGLGYGTDTGPRGTLGFSWIPINSYGHHINLMARGSYIKTGGQARQNNTINGSYIIPGKDPATDSYAITAGYGDIIQDTGTARSLKTAVSYNTLLTDDWQQTLALTYLRERYQLTDVPNTDANVLYPSGHWQYIHNRTAQNQQIVNNGISATFDLAGTAQTFVAKNLFFGQEKMGLKALGTLDVTHTRFLFRSQVGDTQIRTLKNLPLTLQLFAGGPTSIRGFKYNSIGPGRNLVILSGEIQQKVYGNWYVSGFVDSGVVSGSDASLENKGNGHYKVGAGGGVVFLTQIGAVELALARPVVQGGKTWQLEFSVGAEL